jgi:hypothetical protein
VKVLFVKRILVCFNDTIDTIDDTSDVTSSDNVDPKNLDEIR